MKKSPVTQNDIARKLNVSRITVSKALRNHPDISAGMKDKVLRAAADTGYSPNLIAANLSQGKTNTIGVVIPDLENSFFSFLTDSIIDSATDRNYRTVLTVSREKTEIELMNLRNLIGMRVDGLLVCVSQTTLNKDIFEYAGKVGIPVVFFDRWIKSLGYRYVSFNDWKGTNEAINSLVSAGYTRIGHFAGYPKISIGRERSNAFKSAMKKHSLEVRKEWIIEGGFETEDGYRSFEKLKKLPELPEAILAVNDRVALGLYRAVKDAGLRIPEDISIVGFGFKETAVMFNPPLAIINQDPRLMGVTAASMLIDEIEGKKNTKSKIRIPEEFIWNESLSTKSKAGNQPGLSKKKL